MRSLISVGDFADYVKQRQEAFKREGASGAVEAAAKILEKLGAPGAAGMRRVYRRVAQGFAVADLISQDELKARHYVETASNSENLVGDEPVEDDTVTSWISDRDPDRELLLGQPLVS